MEWRESEGVRWLEAELPGARAAFSTRLGGESEGSLAGLNLGLLTGDEPVRVGANRRRLAAALGLEPERVAIGRQVHGAGLAHHEGPQEPAFFATPGHDPPEVDGHTTAERGLALLVLVADCLPIALAGERGVAMVHGGWRGLRAGIVGAAVERTAARAAAIGPAIGPCCYEVGEEVLAAFAPLGDGFAEGPTLDLPALARCLLERAGIEQIETAELCTRCNPELFFSHRGEGPDTGRQAGLVWKEAEWPG